MNFISAHLLRIFYSWSKHKRICTVGPYDNTRGAWLTQEGCTLTERKEGIVSETTFGIMLPRYETNTPRKIFTSSISSNAEQPDTPVIAGITSAASLRWSATWAGIEPLATRRRNMRLCMMYNITHTVVGDPWAEWLATTKRVTRGFHAWKYIPIYSQHKNLQIVILTPHNNRLEYSVTPLS